MRTFVRQPLRARAAGATGIGVCVAIFAADIAQRVVTER